MVSLGAFAPRTVAAAEPEPEPEPEPVASARPKPASEAEVARVRVELSVWRGGDRTDEGERIPRRRAQVDGRATYELVRPAVAGQRLILLDYAELLRDEPHELDEIALSTYVAGVSERARMTVEAAQADGRALASTRAGGRRDIVIELPAGATEVQVDYRVEVPHRYWPLGCVWRRCSLSGAVAPLPSERARGGIWLPADGRVVTPVEWVVERARFAAVPDWTPGTAPTPEQDRALAGQELVVTRESINTRAPIAYPSVFWGPRWQHSERWHRGVHLRILHINRRPGAQYPNENILNPIRDVAGHVTSIATDAIDLAGVIGIEPPPDAELTVVQGPLRSDVSMFHPSAVMVSDQYLELLGTKRLAKFHDIQVARSICDLLSYGQFAGRHDPSTDLWLSGSFGVALATLWQRARELRDEYAVDLLASLTFIPSIDSFLYTGQAAFSSAYFRGSEDQWPVRNHPLFFAHELPSGRRIHEKLSDLLTEREMAEFYATMADSPDSDPQIVAEQVWGRELGWFFDQWLGPYPKVDYAITDLRSTRREDGRWHHEITVTRDSDRPLVEPIQIYVDERGGQDHYLVWNGEAEPGAALLDQPSKAQHVFVLDTERKLRAVRLDPRSRLVETSRIPVDRLNRGDNNDPLFNNRKPAKARFIYTGIGLNVAASELATAKTAQARINAITAFFAFESSLRRDLRRTGSFLVFTDPETNVGGSAGINFYFGEKRNRQRRRLRLRMSTSVAWLNTGGLDAAGGLRIIQSTRLSHDTRKFGLWPERGHLISAGISSAQTLRLDGETDHRYALDLDLGWAQLWRVAHHHVIASLIEASVVVPLASELEFRSLNRGGGIGRLSGFTSNELFGRGVARAALEYRHVILDDLRLPLFNLIFVRTLSGALFGGVASVSGCDSYAGWFGAQSWYGQVGYGLAARLQWFGVVPQFIRVDAAVPLGRRRGVACLGETLPEYLGEVQGIEDVGRLLPPFNINVTFNQPF
ncbi:hypothetical protein ENSA5_00040 [Enhygromyxa salina]|uniref:Uncharacterized protein n=1 Tax=Enhygromyxa salina TaxID=215803 RepID=A0A2S9YLB9_9BACT|nr:hypothetical protein [Enhygromyxa salina]PRQ05893.1 hypothetical protein ENSA5_00040 [Enhygromyxa salina]